MAIATWQGSGGGRGSVVVGREEQPVTCGRPCVCVAAADCNSLPLSSVLLCGLLHGEVEADLLDSRQELANALVQYRRAVLDEDLTTGALLKHHNLEISQQQLKRQTASLMPK